MNKRSFRIALVALVLCLMVSMACAQATKETKKEFAFKGKVEAVDATAKTLSVNGENVPGWMSAMTMTYTVDKVEVLKTLKAGDQITAKVYEGDFKVLHDVKVVPAQTAPKK